MQTVVLTPLLSQNDIPLLPAIQTLSSNESSASTSSNSALNLLFAKTTAAPNPVHSSASALQQTPSPARIESAEFYENILIIGTSDGQIISYTITQDRESGDLECTLHQKKMLATGRKPVEQLHAIVAESKLLVLSETSVMFHSLRSLTAISSASSSQNFKAITAVALDKVLEPPFNFCVAKRRSLHLYYITENQLGTTKEIPLADGAILLRKCGRSILAADAQNYKLVNEKNGSVTTLFPYDRAVMKPIICAIGRSEFLLVLATAPGVALGMFVNSNGDAVRVFHFPYTIALLRTNVLEIHNLFTQELHATVPIPSPALFLQDTSFPLQLHSQKRTMKTVVVCSGGVVLGVLVKRVEGQIEEFLEAREVGKAIQLAELAVQWGETGDTKKQVFDRIYEQAGVLYFKDLSFDEAVKCFKKGDVDPFILINEFGGIVAVEGAEYLVPWKEDIEQALLDAVRAKNPNVENEEQIAELWRKALQQGKDALTTYFLSARNKDYAVNSYEHIDNFLLVVYEQAEPTSLNTFLSIPNYCNVAKAEEFLWKRERYYALSLLLKSTSQTRKVLEIWMRLLSGEYEDEEFEGSEMVAEYLSKVNDESVFLEYAKRLLVIDPVLGVKVFLTTSLSLPPSKVLPILEQHGPLALCEYLESLRSSGKSDITSDQHLLKLYLADLKSSYSKEPLFKTREAYIQLPSPRPVFAEYLATQATENRRDTQTVLRYKISSLLSTTQLDSKMSTALLAETLLPLQGFFYEHATIHSEQGNIRDALSIWVRDLMDFKAAERAVVESGDRELFRVLINLYLEGGNHPFYGHEYSAQAMWLLNTYPDVFDLAEILALLPDRWSLAALSGYFSSRVRESAHKAQEQLLMKALVKGANFKTNARLVDWYNSVGPLVVKKGEECVVCRKAVDSHIVILPVSGDTKTDRDGSVKPPQVAHVKCVRL
ncbi:hypothetical protein HDU79_003758 [Rhizoclosmatium sp. JEL0117]|nr:hypothetical protein HDU79_003758 [Rhizoclosmatium sp. JEL0117]